MSLESLQKDPSVSILLPVYDPEPDWLRRAIESVLEQRYENKELVIVDDGSPTPVRGILDEDILDFDGVTVVRQSNEGFAGATNRAFRESTGRYVAPIAQDDYWAEGKLQKQIDAVENGYDLIFGRVNVVNADGETIGEKGDFPDENRLEQLFFESYPIYESLLLDRELISCERLLDESFDVAADWDLWFRIWPDADIKYLDTRVATKRRHSNKLSAQRFHTLIEEDERIIETYSKKYDIDDRFREETLSNLYQNKGIRLYRRGDRKDARRLWQKGTDLEIINPKLYILLYFSFVPPLWYVTLRTYSLFRNIQPGKTV